MLSKPFKMEKKDGSFTFGESVNALAGTGLCKEIFQEIGVDINLDSMIEKLQ